MSVFSKLIGVIDAADMQVLRQVIAEVRDEERIPTDDPEYSQAMADAILAVQGRVPVEVGALKDVARNAVRRLLIEQAMLVKDKDGSTAGASR